MELDSFTGFVEFNEEMLPFVYSDKVLTILPNTVEKLQEYNMKYIREVFSFNKVPRILGKRILTGFTEKEMGIKFFCDEPVYDNSRKLNINYIYIYNLEAKKDIKYISFIGPECNYFYNLNNYVKFDYNIDGSKLKDLIFEMPNIDNENLGGFKWKGSDINVHGGYTWKKGHDIYEPLQISSVVSLKISDNWTDFYNYVNLISLQKRVLSFCSYRKNIKFDEIRACDDDKTVIGYFYDLNTVIPENDKKAIVITLNANTMGINTSKIYQLESNNQIYPWHIQQNYISRLSYDSVRVLEIFVAFENLNKVVYNGEKTSTSMDAAKNLIYDGIEYVLKTRKTNTRIRDKINHLKEVIEISNLSYGENLKRAINDNLNIIKKYIINNYFGKEGKNYDDITDEDIKEVVDNISKRCNNYRNGMAHGNLDVIPSTENMLDVKLVERLIYGMVLSYIGVDEKTAYEQICSLFGDKF